MPLRNIEYPAITICSQGIVQDVIDKALKKQFDDFVTSLGLDPTQLSSVERDKLQINYTTDLYPGATTSPASLVNVLVSDNPTESIKSKVLTDPAAACVDTPSDCEDPWFANPAIKDVCFANFGETRDNERNCEKNGGIRMGFYDQFPYTVEFTDMLEKGEFSVVNRSRFWYNAYEDNGEILAMDGTLINDLYLFSFMDSYPNTSMIKNPCITANIYDYFATGGYFEYSVFNCQPGIQAYELCIREKVDCELLHSDGTSQQGYGGGTQGPGNTSPSPPLRRKKRQLHAAASPTPTLDSVFVQAKKILAEESALKSRASYNQNFRSMNLQKSYKSLFEILWYSQLPCFDVQGVTSTSLGQYGMLKHCNWQGVDVPCSKIFETFPTDQGMCCTFNMEAADKMFKDSQYQDMVAFMQERDRNMSFDTTNYEFEDPIPEAGRTKGLSLILDAHSDMVSGGTVSQDFDGFFAIIDGRNQFPTTTRKSVLLRPGHENIVAINAVDVKGGKSIKGIPVDKRNCFFPEDKVMKLHQEYSQANCILECQIDFALSQMNLSDPCLPWYFPIPKDNSSRLCDPWEAADFRTNMKKTPSMTCDFCLPDCNTTMYTASVTAAPFRKCDYKNLGVSKLCSFDTKLSPPIWGQQVLSQYIDELPTGVPPYISNIVSTNRRNFADAKASGKPVFTAETNNKPTYDAYEKDIAMVTFFFESTTALQYSRELRMTPVGFISQVGGLMGLCLGVSFISLIEMVYWFTIRFLRNM